MTIQKPVDVIIVDDEEAACNNLRNILATYIDVPVNVLGIATDTRSAETLIALHQPDAIFLDIDMPLENGFAFLQRIQPFSFEVIFVTAYDEYAVKAFRLNAIDYILKPVNIPDLNSALHRLYERCLLKALTGATYRHIQAEPSGTTSASAIMMREGSEVIPVQFKDLLCFEANRSYSRIAFWKGSVEKQVTMSYTLSDYEGLLPASSFYRIHKSYLINCTQIEKVLREQHPVVVLKNQMKLPVGRRRYQDFLSFIQANNFIA